MNNEDFEETLKKTQRFSSAVMNAGRILDYQSDAVVSKEVLRRDKGTITVFAIWKDQEISEHTTPYEAMVYVIEGEMEITISGKSQVLSDDELIIMPPDEPHALKALQNSKFLLVMINPLKSQSN